MQETSMCKCFIPQEVEMSRKEINEMKKGKGKKSACAVKSKKAFSAGMNIGRRMKKPKGKSK